MDIVIKTLDYPASAVDVFASMLEEALPFFLDSSLSHAQRGRHSILGCDPFQIVRGKDKNFLDLLDDEFKSYRNSVRLPPGVPFAAGAVGALSYDYGLPLQNIASRHQTPWPYGVFGFYDAAVVIDHQDRKMHVVSTGLPEIHPSLRRRRANERAERLLNLIKNYCHSGFHGNDKRMETPFKLHSNMTREEYLAMVRRAKDLIAAGEIYQVNLSQKFTCPRLQEQSGFDIYCRLRQISPSSFSAYFDAGDFALISSSPERFLCSDGKKIHSIPMKGTRRRGKNSGEDEHLKRDLWNSAKDQAELLMITDLMRSDLGRVCEYGSVSVASGRELEEYATVYQTTSTVEGVLKEEVSPFEILHSAFPGGSITGCPKIRAMQIIDELEPESRGFYTGALGYVGFNGAMDFNMLIRTIVADRRQLSFHAGGGIVADSDPEKEYEETLIKAEAMKRAIQEIDVSHV